MKTNKQLMWGIALAIILPVFASAADAQKLTREDIIKQREANLSKILAISEQRFKTGTLQQNEVLKARLDLLRFKRGAASALTEKIAIQEKIVTLREEQKKYAQQQHAVGVVDELAVLRATDDLLAEQQLLSDLPMKKE